MDAVERAAKERRLAMTKQISRDDMSRLAAYLFGMGTTGADIGCTDRTKIREAAAMLRSLWDHIEELSGVAEGKLVAIGRGPLTPTDMETAMSEMPPACFDPIPELVLENWDGVSDAVRRAALEKAVKSHQALSALGDPVVVAEALPELVTKGRMLARRAKDAGVSLPLASYKETLYEEAEEFEDLLAKLKARP